MKRQTPAQRLAAMKARQAATMAAARRRVKGRRPEKRRWPWLLLLLVLLVVVLIALCCCCGWPKAEPPEEPAPEPIVQPVVPAPAPPAVPSPPPPGKVVRRDRPQFAPPKPETVPWLSAFEMQVAARGPRLAACFVGVDLPGRLKWSAEIEPRSGAVSDARLEPTLGSESLTAAQNVCVMGVLADPPYRLEVDDRATPSRVGWVIEF